MEGFEAFMLSREWWECLAFGFVIGFLLRV